jgi:Flp pilus assembly protein TadB
MDPMFRGWGIFWLVAAGAWAAIGFFTILRMVKVEV